MKNNANCNLAIVGALPAPYGGVSVHLLRLINRLDDANISYTFYNTGPSNVQRANVVKGGRAIWVLLKLFTFKEEIIHFNNNRQNLMFFAAIVSQLRHKKIIWTLHDEFILHWYEKAGSVSKFLFRVAIKKLAHIICVNDRIRVFLLKLGVKPENISVIPAFIKPTAQETSDKNLCTEILEFINSHNPIIGSHGWFGGYINNFHVYSFDMLGAMIKAVRQHYPKAGLYTVVSGCNDQRQRENILKFRKENHLETSWLIIEKPFTAVAVYARTAVFVRPSVTDGDSVSVRECLSLGVPVIASNAVWRPQECILFENRNQQELDQTVMEFLKKPYKIDSGSQKDYGLEVIKVYKDLLETGR
jgi:glycosyltransferase involved in cell wall biosynthesis